MGNAQCQNHLALPKGNGIYQSGLDLLCHQGVIALYQTDLGCCLDGDHAGQFQVMDLLLKSLAHGIQVLGCLGILRKTASLGFLHKLRKVCAAHFLEFLLSGQNVHGKLFKIIQVQRIHLVHGGSVLHKLNLVLLQGLYDLRDICLRLGIFCLHSFYFIGAAFEQAAQSLFLLGCIEAFELCHHIAQKISHFTQVLCLYLFQSLLGKIRHLFLGSCPVLQNGCGIADINLF